MISRFLAIGSILLFGGTASAQQIQDDFQIQGDFDKDWVTDTKGNGALPGKYLRPGTQPDGWEASNVHQKVLMEVKETLVTPDVDRKENPNGHSVLLTNKEVGALGKTSPAPAYITLGVPWVYAQATLSKCDGGTLGGINFSKRPDAIRGWYKRTGNSGKSQVIVYAWKGTYTSTVSTNPNGSLTGDVKATVQDQDRCIINDEGYDSKTEGAKLIAKCDESITGETSEWKPFEFDLQYENNEIPEKINVVISACDYWSRSNIVPDETMTVDDVEFVYWSNLRSLSYDGTPINIDDPENIQIAAKNFDLSKVSCTSGHGAEIQKNYDPSTGILTITIEGEDVSVNTDNYNTYRVKVVPPTPEDVKGKYNRWITVNLTTPISESANDIYINPEDDGEVSFSLNDFYLDLGGGLENFGPVTVPNAKLGYKGDGSINIVAENQMVVVSKLGEDPIPISLTANMSEGKKLTADLNILDGFVTVNVGDIPFTTSEENGILKVTGTVSTLGAASVKGTSTANVINVIDLTGANLATGLNSSDFSAEANNTLYKISGTQSLNGNNVIQNGTCENLVLTDGLTFNAPEEFTATNVTFNREFKAGNLSTVVLPFSFETANVNGTVYKLESVENGVLSFKSVEGTAEANVPYLVQTEGENLFKETFKGATVAQTPETVENSITGTGVTHVGNFGETMNITSDDQTSWYGYNTNGSFVKVLSGTVKPFRSAIKSTGAAPSSFALKLDGTVTGILNLENPNAKVDVYTVSGVCVRKNVPAASALNGLSRGVYIVGGQKVVK